VTEPILLHQKINLPYRYTAGEFHKAFLRGLTERRIVGSRCDACDTLAAPARPFCPNCSAHSSEVVDLAPEGVLVSWTTVEREGRAITFGLVRFAGADTEMLHLLDTGAVEPTEGMSLVPRWADEPIPDITAIEAFVPA
jgi:uncharacterized OB-fold protein